MTSAVAPLRPLILAFWTPPVVRPQAMLIGKMIPEWVRQGAQPLLVRYEGCGPWEPPAPMEEVPQFRLPLGGRVPFLGALGREVYWRRTARAIAPLARRHRANVIYAFANPMDADVIGAHLARQTGLPLVAHFSDPWVDERLYHTPRLRTWHRRWQERFVVRTATRVTVVEEAMRRAILDRYPPQVRGKGVVIPHCYDPAAYPDPSPRDDGLFVVSHVGALLSRRTPRTLLQAAALLRERSPGLFERLRIRLVGAITPYGDYPSSALDALIRATGLPPGTVEVVPPVSYAESLGLMQQADCLITIEPEEAYFITMKVVDYAGAGRPIAAIAPEGSSTAQAVEALGFPSFRHADAAGLADYLAQVARGGTSGRVNEAARARYHVRETTARLLGVLREALEGQRGA